MLPELLSWLRRYSSSALDFQCLAPPDHQYYQNLTFCIEDVRALEVSPRLKQRLKIQSSTYSVFNQLQLHLQRSLYGHKEHRVTLELVD